MRASAGVRARVPLIVTRAAWGRGKAYTIAAIVRIEDVVQANASRKVPLIMFRPAARAHGFTIAGIAQLVEHNLAKVGVAGSSPVSRLPAQHLVGRLAQLVRAPR